MGRRFTFYLLDTCVDGALLFVPRGGGVAVLSFLCLSSAANAPAAGAARLRSADRRAHAVGVRARGGQSQRVQFQLPCARGAVATWKGPAVPLGPPRPRLGGGELRTLARACAASTQPLRPKFSCCIDNECCCSRPEGGVSSTRISHGVRLKLRLCLTENRWLGSSGVCVS